MLVQTLAIAPVRMASLGHLLGRAQRAWVGMSVCVLVACGKICLLGAESDPHFEFLSWVCLEGDPLRNHSCSGQAVARAALTTDDVRRHFLMGGSYRLWPAAGRGRKQRGYFKTPSGVQFVSWTAELGTCCGYSWGK